MLIDERIEKQFRVRQLEKEIKELKKEKRQIRFRKGLCGITAAGIILGVASIPSVMTTLICIGQNRSPFKRDATVKEAHIETVFNTNNGVEVSKQYEPYNSEKNELRYHTEWKKTPNNDYISNVITYDATNLTYNDVEQIVKGEKELSDPVKEEVLHKKYISENLLGEGTYYDGVVYETNPDDCITVLQTKDEDLDDQFACYIMPLIFDAAFAAGAIFVVCPDGRAYDIYGKKFNPYNAFRNIDVINKRIDNKKEKKNNLVKILREDQHKNWGK